MGTRREHITLGGQTSGVTKITEGELTHVGNNSETLAAKQKKTSPHKYT